MQGGGGKGSKVMGKAEEAGGTDSGKLSQGTWRVAGEAGTSPDRTNLDARQSPGLELLSADY